MFTEEYSSKMKTFQDTLIEFLQEEDSSESDLSNIIRLLDKLRIRKDQGDFKLILHMLLKLSDVSTSDTSIIPKIEQILIKLKKDIKHFFSNDEIFIIFQKNKRILYILIKNKILAVNKFIANRMINNDWFKNRKYPQFFFPEIRPFISEKEVDEISGQIPENFEEKREIGENDNFICKIIRNDSLQKFKSLQKSNKIESLDISVEQSIFETHLLLLKNETTLIEYAAFYGSSQIFNYLMKNKVFTSNLLILYAIHGGDQEMIHVLRENKELLDNYYCVKTINESIKCHCNGLAKYIIKRSNLDDISNFVNTFSLKHYNFAFIQKSEISKDSFIQLCKYDYFNLVDFFINKLSQEEINKSNDIQNHNFFYKTALYSAVEKENIEIIKLLLNNDKIDVNIPYILILNFIKFKIIFLMEFIIKFFNEIQNHVFQLHSKSYLSISFKIISFNKIQTHIFQ